MIVDLAQVDAETPLHADIVVVGSGIAGAEVAVRLARAGRDVMVLESGREEFDPAIQALNDLVFEGKPHRAMAPDASYHRYLPPSLRGVSRVRQFGGTSNVWTGKWLRFEPGDLTRREWIPGSGWPIPYEELLQHYRSVERDYGFADIDVEAARLRRSGIEDEIARDGLSLRSFYWEREPTRTAVRFGTEMRTSTNLRVLLGATVGEICTTHGGDVHGVEVRELGGGTRTVSTDTVVLAAGALETARILLASTRGHPGGLGNEHDLVGRFFSDHLKTDDAWLEPGPLLARFASEFQRDPKPRFCLALSLDDTTKRRERLLEHQMYFKPVYEGRRQRVRSTLSRKRRPRDGIGSVAGYQVKLASEQTPNRDSRLFLGADRDAMGQRVAHLDWHFTDDDHRSVSRTADLLTERLATAGVGRLDLGTERLTVERMTDAAHHMGTTRMALRPDDGVVDTDCRVFGTNGVYVAGSAVFPCGPGYSPTLTILALAHRLADHLRRRGAT